jgi:phenylalanyl-tRNA synthetase beta chain
MRDTLKEQSYYELLPLSLLGPEALRKVEIDPDRAVGIGNPIGEELSLLQASHLPSLLDHAERALDLVQRELRTFHIGHVFEKGKEEQNMLTMMVTAKHETDLRHDPFLTVKQGMGMTLDAIGFTASTTPVVQCPAYAHPGRFATISVLGTLVGELFEVHPDVRERFKLPARAAAATINLTALLAMQGVPKIATPLPHFPGISYDETMTRAHSEEVRDTLKRLVENTPLLERAEIIDLYDGKPFQKGNYSLTVHFTYRALDRTLTEEEAQKVHTQVLGSLKT